MAFSDCDHNRATLLAGGALTCKSVSLAHVSREGMISAKGYKQKHTCDWTLTYHQHTPERLAAASARVAIDR